MWVLPFEPQGLAHGTNVQLIYHSEHN